jgi:hypothetical protein
MTQKLLDGANQGAIFQQPHSERIAELPVTVLSFALRLQKKYSL